MTDSIAIETWANWLYWASRDAVRAEIQQYAGKPTPFIDAQVKTCIAAHAMKMFVNLGFSPDKQEFKAVCENVLEGWKQWEKDGVNEMYKEVQGEASTEM